MKVCFCLLITLVGLVLNIPAQSETIDSQKLFLEAAKRVLKNKGVYTGIGELEEYAYKANGRIYLLPKEDREKEAALILLELQAADPRYVIVDGIRGGKGRKEKIPLRANLITSEYLKALVAYCLRSKTDPLRVSINLMERKGSLENETLDEEVVKVFATDKPEETFVEALISAKEKIDEIGLHNLKPNNDKLRGSFPWCVLFRNC